MTPYRREYLPSKQGLTFQSNQFWARCDKRWSCHMDTLTLGVTTHLSRLRSAGSLWKEEPFSLRTRAEAG